MASKPEEILETAKWLLSDAEQSEAFTRVIINRSYYSMYHKVLGTLDNEPVKYGDVGVHGTLIEYLKSPDAKRDESIEFRELRKLSYMLEQEKFNRVKADYHMDKEIDWEQAKQTLAAAERCFNRCDEMLKAS
ncbi:hypothetical protein EHW61_16025 [Salinivibrio sp. VYel6]|uniref:hypothetical protein n=1 Tax=Salinivibrio sp. VYel6 TaxID=2490493 RepID=UPI00128D1E77|nr:hypothetical protein [Salinivibrio sp. VYel6]MPX98137.1 hypothetical protein [Salinivibrio sp. VYel6]